MKMLLFELMGALMLLYIDRQGFFFVATIMILLSPFMVAYWAAYLWRPKVEREGDLRIMEDEIQKKGAK